MSFLYAAVPYSKKKNVRMEDAAHCRHKPSSLLSPHTPVMKSIYLDFRFSPFSVTCQASVTFGCDCLIVKKKKRKTRKKTSS